jgi:hypothetical protein
MAINVDNLLDKQIEELYGLGMTPTMGHLKTKVDPFQSSGINRQQTPSKNPKLGHQCEFSLSGWQSEVYNRYKQGRRDAIISVPPAAGKTGPVLCAWKGEFTKFLYKRIELKDKSARVPRIAFVVPTQQLAFQIAKQDFLRDKKMGLLRMVAQNPELFQPFLPLLTKTYAPQYDLKRDPRTGRPLINLGVIPIDELTGQPVFIEYPKGSDKYILAKDPTTRRPYVNPNTRTLYTMRDFEALKSPQTQPNLAKLSQSDINEIYKLVSNEFIGNLFGGASMADAYPSSTRGIFGGLKPIIVGTYEPIRKLMKKSGREFDIVCIDETQQFLGKPEKQSLSKDDEERQKAFIEIIKYTPKDASLFLMTGSTNDKTVEDIKDLVNDSFSGRQLVKIPRNLPKGQDDARADGQANRSKINIMPFDKIQKKDDLVDICKDIVRKKQINSIMLLFSVRRMTVGGIFRLIEDIVDEKKMPIINREYVGPNKDHIDGNYSHVGAKHQKNLTPDRKERNRTIHKLEKALKDSHLFSDEEYTSVQNHIDDLKLGRANNKVANIELDLKGLEDKLEDVLKDNTDRRADYNKIKSEIENLRKHMHHELTSKYGTDDENHNSIKNVDTYDRHIRDRNKDITASDLADREASDYISDNPPLDLKDADADVNEIEFLKYFDIRALEQPEKFRNKALDRPDSNNLLYQAVLRGMGVMTGSMHQRHKETIQKLFKSGKLPLLFASDALGVGANVKCKHLYIPKLMKMDGSEFGPLDQSSLVQLINRAGRGAFPVAYVYCSTGDYEHVKKFIEEDPRTTVDQIDAAPFGNLVKLAKKQGKFVAFQHLYKLFSNKA